MNHGEPAVVHIQGDVDFTKRADFRRSLESLLEADLAVIDFSLTSYMDSTAISELLRFNRARARLKRAAPRLVLGTGVTRLLEVAGIDVIFPTFASLEEAVRR